MRYSSPNPSKHPNPSLPSAPAGQATSSPRRTWGSTGCLVARRSFSISFPRKAKPKLLEHGYLVFFFFLSWYPFAGLRHTRIGPLILEDLTGDHSVCGILQLGHAFQPVIKTPHAHRVDPVLSGSFQRFDRGFLGE